MQYCKNNNIECFYLKFKKISISLNKNDFLKNTIKIFLIPFISIYTFFLNRIAVKKLQKIIKMNEIEFVHTNIVRDELGILINKKYHIKHIMHLREYGKEDFGCVFIRKNYLKVLDKYTVQFIAISKSIKEAYIEKGINERKIVVIYNGVPPIVNKKDNYDLSKEYLKIVQVGALSEAKGQLQVIEAIEILKNKYGDYFKLYLYGTGEKKYLKYLNRKIKELNLEKNVFFMGQNANVTEELYKYDLAITSSKSEAFGRVTVEYMLAKVPVIVSDTGANCELINSNKGGLIYKFNDCMELSNCIYRYYLDTTLREKTALFSYDFAKKNFLAEKNEIEIKKIYMNN